MGKIIRIYITENCNSKCANCFNAHERGTATIDIEHFLELCDYFKSNGVDTIKIMGGEPTVHPYFLEIMKIAQDYFPEVYLFTNAINDKILDFNPRQNDAIIYNFRFSKQLTESKLLLDKPGRRSLEIQITNATKIDKVYSEIISVCGNFTDRINPCLTFDCTQNIFENKDVLINKYIKIRNLCEKFGFVVGQDHLVPLCFLYGSEIKMPQTGCICQENCAGLIDANYNIKFCNQYPQILGNLYESKALMPFEKYLNLLSMQRTVIQNTAKEKLCGRCPFYDLYCNGGCFISKEYIKADSVLTNTTISEYISIH